MIRKKIKKLLKATKEVFREISYENGAITSSSARFRIYPKDVKGYDFVWPRDASYICVAADYLAMHKISRKFFKWCLNYAEGLKEEGVFLYHKFFPNGRAAGDYDHPLRIGDLKNKRLIKILKSQVTARCYYSNFQPDETGSLLWAIEEHSKYEDISEFKGLVKIVANGICKYWRKSHFKIPSKDLWEERTAWPNLDQTHTYSLAMCKKGLEAAERICGQDKKWSACINQMRKRLENSVCKLEGRIRFVRTFGKKIDKEIDSSLLGLVWPSNAFDVRDSRIIQTVVEIEEKCVKDGVYRYVGDRYDGKIVNYTQVLGGAGSWPILNFWLSIYFSLANNREKALKYFNWVIERVDNYIPEQIKDGKPASVIPLGWSHAMFVIAGKYLNLF